MLLNEMMPTMVILYWDWRITYWSSSEGVRLQAYKPKRCGAKTNSTQNAKKVPAAKTLFMEQSVLNQLFYNVFEHGYMQQVFKMQVSRNNNKPTRCTGFEVEEDNKLTRY